MKCAFLFAVLILLVAPIAQGNDLMLALQETQSEVMEELAVFQEAGDIAKLERALLLATGLSPSRQLGALNAVDEGILRLQIEVLLATLAAQGIPRDPPQERSEAPEKAQNSSGDSQVKGIRRRIRFVPLPNDQPVKSPEHTEPKADEANARVVTEPGPKLSQWDLEKARRAGLLTQFDGTMVQSLWYFMVNLDSGSSARAQAREFIGQTVPYRAARERLLSDSPPDIDVFPYFPRGEEVTKAVSENTLEEPHSAGEILAKLKVEEGVNLNESADKELKIEEESNHTREILSARRVAVEEKLHAFTETGGLNTLEEARKLAASLNPREREGELDATDEGSLRLQLKVLLAADAARDRSYDPEAPENQFSVHMGPPGYDVRLQWAWMDPNIIKDSKVRLAYKKAIIENTRKARKSMQELMILREVDYGVIWIWRFIHGMAETSAARRRAAEIVTETVMDEVLRKRLLGEASPGLTR